MTYKDEYIDEFLNELHSRIDLVSSSKVTSNIDNSSYKDIINILKKYNIASNSISLDDLKKLSYEDLQSIVMYILPESEISNYKIMDELKYLRLLHLLNKYIIEYNNIDENQTNLFKDKCALYSKYIELFSDTPEKPFTDFDELKKVMTELGLPVDVRWHILKTINTINMDNFFNKYGYLLEGVNSLTGSILDLVTSSELNIIEETLKEHDLDIDLIDIISKSINDSTGIHYDIVFNVLIMICSSTLYYELCKSDDEDLIEDIEYLLSRVKYMYPSPFYRAYYILSENFDKMYEIRSLNIDSSIIIDSSLDKLESIAHSREGAIDLKESLVLESLFETWSNVRVNDENMNKKMILINKFLDQVELYEAKKKNIKEL